MDTWVEGQTVKTKPNSLICLRDGKVHDPGGLAWIRHARADLRDSVDF